MYLLTIEGLALGMKRRARLFEDFSVPVPPPDPEQKDDGGMTLRQLIERIVRHEVAAFNERQSARQFIRALGPTEIAEGAKAGKIDSGGHEEEPRLANADEAVGVAIQAFEDGLYLVVIDDFEKRDLDAQVFLTEDSKMTFIRLTMLAG